MTLRLRQICLVTKQLETALDQIAHVFGLQPCHRDEAVGKYGLANALFVCGHQFLEIVAPISGQADDSTAAGRYLQRSGGRGGYMAIFDTHDPERRMEHVQALGVRIAHTLDHPGEYWGIQLHPRDSRATMLEFDRTTGNEHLDGAYWPAGPHWQQGQRVDLVAGIPAVELESPHVADLAAHWSRLIECPLQEEHGKATLQFELGSVRFVPAPPQTPERMCRLDMQVTDPALVRARAAQIGLPARGDGFDFCGVTVVPVA